MPFESFCCLLASLCAPSLSHDICAHLGPVCPRVPAPPGPHGNGPTAAMQPHPSSHNGTSQGLFASHWRCVCVRMGIWAPGRPAVNCANATCMPDQPSLQYSPLCYSPATAVRVEQQRSRDAQAVTTCSPASAPPPPPPVAAVPASLSTSPTPSCCWLIRVYCRQRQAPFW